MFQRTTLVHLGAEQEVDDIFGDPDELLELYQRGKAARGGSRLEPVEEAPERLEDEDDDEADARQEAFSQRQARCTPPVLGSGPGPIRAGLVKKAA